ncbi:MAG: hypothetical protein MK365_00890 [Vicinamibacterales bacterium]|nr:hypothetical protein [Vicinamibacterales bacterium]HIN10766.1 hypothetical protein [Acidobacteriota bacterium]
MRRAGSVMIASWVLSIGGCTPATGGDVGPGSGSSGGETVVLSVDHRSRWRELRIEGTTDLPDGAVVSYHVTHALAEELPPSEWPAQNLIADGTAVVQESQYWTRLNTTYWPAGAVRVQVQFPIAPQPATVRGRYGEFGEHLTGDNVTILGASKVVTAEHTLEWTR